MTAWNTPGWKGGGSPELCLHRTEEDACAVPDGHDTGNNEALSPAGGGPVRVNTVWTSVFSGAARAIKRKVRHAHSNALILVVVMARSFCVKLHHGADQLPDYWSAWEQSRATCSLSSPETIERCGRETVIRASCFALSRMCSARPFADQFH